MVLCNKYFLFMVGRLNFLTGEPYGIALHLFRRASGTEKFQYKGYQAMYLCFPKKGFIRMGLY